MFSCTPVRKGVFYVSLLKHPSAAPHWATVPCETRQQVAAQGAVMAEILRSSANLQIGEGATKLPF